MFLAIVPHPDDLRLYFLSEAALQAQELLDNHRDDTDYVSISILVPEQQHTGMVTIKPHKHYFFENVLSILCDHNCFLLAIIYSIPVCLRTYNYTV